MNKPRYTLDTNLLIYAIDTKTDADKHQKALTIVNQAVDYDCVLTLQVLGEFFSATTRKGKMPLTEAFQQVKDWQELFPVVAATPDCLNLAITLTSEHSLSFWDALIWATAKHAGVTHLLSEDFQEGRILEGLTVINPFRLNPFEENDQVV